MKSFVILLFLLLSLPAHAQTVVVEAETMMLDQNLGGPYGPGMMVWSNGTLQSNVIIPSAGTYHVDVVARGDFAQGMGPTMDVKIDSVTVGPILITSTSFVTYSIGIPPLSAGTHSFSISFTNDLVAGVEDRNLYIDKTTFWVEPLVPLNVIQGKWKLQWDPNTETDLAGYRVYRSEQQNYGSVIGTTMQTTYEDPAASAGHTFYYTVTAYDTSMNESLHSTMVAVTVTYPPVNTPDIIPPMVVRLQ